jgi:NAD(P)-dependent dehydrogenase (short-subunit alcohol dehydrogenase family)
VGEKLLDGKIAVVTGAGQGIGRGYAFGVAEAGAKVVVADLNAERGAGVVDELQAAGHEALFVHTDVSSEESTVAMAAAVMERFGGVDVLVNNAAFFLGLPTESIEEMPIERWNKVLAVNLTGPLLVTRALLPAFRARGGGAIVNQTSTAAWHASPGRLHYNVSKAALIPLTKTLAKELAKDNIRVNAIAPGPIATEALAGLSQDILDRVMATMCVPRIGQPEDLVGALLFLASDMSSWMSGQVVVVDGGTIMMG